MTLALGFSARAVKAALALGLAFFAATICRAQDQTQTSPTPSAEEAGTSTDLYIMLGDELTFAYTYEDAGSGFWHSDFGSDTESFGVMKNFGLPKTKVVSGYTWVQVGISSFTGAPSVQNHFYNGDSLGAVVHFNLHNSTWIQETFNKIVTVPWYTTTSVGYTRSS